ncbi:diguanylate cyclase [Oxalobacteraceae bacterium A2-2]
MNGLVDAPAEGEHQALLQFLYLAPVGLIQAGMDGAITMLNPVSAQLLLPVSRDGGLDNLFDALSGLAPDLRQRCAAHAAAHGTVCDALRLHAPGEPGQREARVLSLTVLKLDQSRLMAVLSDITEQERRERELRTMDAWMNAIMANIADYALVSLDGEGRVRAWNESIGRVTGFDAAAVVGQPYGLFYPDGAISPQRQRERLREADDNGWSLDEGSRLRTDGSHFWGSSMIAPLPHRESDGDPAYCMIIRDMSDRQEARDSLRQATYTDHLTGLANRRAFYEAAELELRRRLRQPAARPLSLLMVDADHFKAINDRHGHPGGDAVLRHLAATMRAVFRQVDVVARVGGEEFAVILPGVGLGDAEAVAHRLREHVEAHPARYEDQAIACTLSIGVAAMAPEMEGADALERLLKHADQALYAAKRAGRNQVASWPGTP